VGFLLLRRACSGLVSGGNARQASAADRVLGNSVGAIEMVARSDLRFTARLAAGDWGCFRATPFLGTTIPAASAAWLLHGVRLYFSISVRVRARQWYEYTVDLSGDSEGRAELEVVDKDQFY
jgi:hypothetical protein